MELESIISVYIMQLNKWEQKQSGDIDIIQNTYFFSKRPFKVKGLGASALSVCPPMWNVED